MEPSPVYAEVIVPLPLKGSFTYAVPEALAGEVEAGMRVMVPFGQNKLYAGIVSRVHHDAPARFEPKEILSVVDDKPLLRETHLRFWDWIANYYMCTPGDVMHAAMPQGLRLQSETVFRPARDFRGRDELTLQERSMLEMVEEDGSDSLDDIRRSPFGPEGVRIARRLTERGALVTGQHVRTHYTPKTIKCIGLDAGYSEEASLVNLLESLKRAKAQVKALETFARLSGIYMDAGETRTVTLGDLTSAGVNSSTVRTLVKKGVLYQYEQEVSRIGEGEDPDQLSMPAKLTGSQQKALEQISKHHEQLPVVLLHGVTASGKTEIYIHLIEEQLRQGKQVLYLMPEIAITTQIISRLKRIFGSKVGIFHSKYSDAERVELYLNVAGHGQDKPYDIILGVRSALFLPFRNLGLIIIDEEHEHTFKQSDPAPRYHARDAATIAGIYHNARLLFGSATPSFESMHNARSGKYGLVELHERFGRVEMPEIIIADVAHARKRKAMRSHFTPELLKALDETLSLDKQAILFQNRRGYSNYLQCTDCGFILKCTRCDVSMTYHKYDHVMVCHYCGMRSPVPGQCPDCHQSSLIMRGFGTEKIEDELGLMYPGLGISRLDLDRIRTRKGFEKILDEFESGKSRVLVGTQLVTKGLDFDNVHLVGVIDADSMMHFPDFRAFERSFQVMMQVSGRSGRRETRGKVVIQTADPGHPVIGHLLRQDYNALFREQMAERKMFRYPPFVRLIRISLRHEIQSILDGGAVFLAGELKAIFGSRVLGPQQPVVSRTHGKFIKQILLKIEKESSFERARALTGELLEVFSLNPVYKQIRVIVDVDPLS